MDRHESPNPDKEANDDGSLCAKTTGRDDVNHTPPPFISYDLDDLIAEITDENRHDLIDFGEPVGREVW